MKRFCLLAVLSCASFSRGGEIQVCSEGLCAELSATASFSLDRIFFDGVEVGPSFSSDGIAAAWSPGGVTEFFGGAVHGGETLRSTGLGLDGAVRRSYSLGPLLEVDQSVSPAPSGSRIEVFQTVRPLAEPTSIVYGLLQNVDASFTTWRSWDAAGGLLEELTADGDSFSQQGFSQDALIARISAISPALGVELSWEHDFAAAADVSWFLVPVGSQGRSDHQGQKLYAKLRGYEGSSSSFTADWSFEASPWSGAVPEPSSLVLFAGTVAASLCFAMSRGSA